MKISVMGGDIPARQTVGSASDSELLDLARHGNAVALEALLVRYQPHLYRFGLRMCGNVEDAGEVAQETLIAMARSLHHFRGDSSVSSWLYTIARRFCLKKRRRNKFAPVGEESLDAPDSEVALRLADPSPGPEQTASNREIETALVRAIDALDRPQREVLLLRDVEGLSAPDVAKALGISIDAVKSRLHRARVAVREQLGPVLGRPAGELRRTPQCPDITAFFLKHIEGDLDPALCTTLESHLEHCSHCRGACDALKRTLMICRQLPTPHVPASLALSIKTALKTFLEQTGR